MKKTKLLLNTNTIKKIIWCGVPILGMASALFFFNSKLPEIRSLTRNKSLPLSRVPASAEECTRFNEQEKFGNFNLTRTYLSAKKACSIGISFKDAPDFSRSYYIYSNGMFMIYNNFNGSSGSNSQSTGSRVFFLFPRISNVSFNYDEFENDMILTASSGQKLKINGTDRRMKKISGARITEDPSINKNNAGGLEFTSNSGLLLDCGWQLGEVAFSRPNRSSQFIDSAGTTCTVQNSEIFAGTGDFATFKFHTDPELYTYLAQACPTLDLSVLEKPTPPVPTEPKPTVPEVPTTPVVPTETAPALIESSPSPVAPAVETPQAVDEKPAAAPSQQTEAVSLKQ